MSAETLIKLPAFDKCVADRDGGFWFLRNRYTNATYIVRETRFLPRGMRARAAVAGYLYALAQAI